jgi:putative ABC transport system substrate-binding protein
MASRRRETASFEVRDSRDYETAFGRRYQTGALPFRGGQPNILRGSSAARCDLAKDRLPILCEWREMAEADCLMSYGPNISDLHHRAAAYVDRIARGAKPADLPVEQPTKFELVINLKTAKALRLMVPQPLLLQADQIIQGRRILAVRAGNTSTMEVTPLWLQ